MGNVFGFAEFELDVDIQQLRRAGEPLRVEALILRLLETFVRNAGRLISKEELVSVVWPGRAVTENSLTVAIARLRKTLGDKRGSDSAAILTVHGRGYRFLPKVSKRDALPSATCKGGGELPFVGREQVLTDVCSAVIKARNGAGGMLVLCGEPGIGKTRIAELAARNAAEAHLAVDWVYFGESDELPALWPLRGLLRDLLAASEIRSDPRIQALLPDLAVLLPELTGPLDARAACRDAGLLALAPSAKPRILDAIASTLALATEARPKLVILDDLDRADETALELLSRILPALPRMHVLIVATLRSTGIDLADAPLSRLLSHRNSQLIRLQPLTDLEVSSYLDALFGELDPALHRAVHRISEGNPFFMVELARQLRHNPQLDASTLVMPAVALELVRQRFTDLCDETVSVLTHAAAIGRTFSLASLRAVTEIHGTALIAHLDEAVSKEIVTGTLRSPSEFSFTHDLIRAALQRTLSPEKWRALHLRVLDILDRRLSLTEAPMSDLAHHASCALPQGDLRKALRYGIEAASAATRACAFADATRHLQLARDALELMESESLLEPASEASALPALRRAPLDALAQGHVPESPARLHRMRG